MTDLDTHDSAAGRRSGWGGVAVVALAAGIVFFDQITKQWVRDGFALGESRPVIDGFFNLTYVRNSGAAWGMFRDYPSVLIVLSFVMLALMVIFRRSFLSDTWDHALAMALMVGGIVGNLLDRIRLSAVTDFLDFHVRGWHWPAFNVADAAICIGVGIYILSAFWIEAHPLKENGVQPDPDADSGTPA